jgi:hypothetical protein
MCLKNQLGIRLRARITPNHFLKKGQNLGILIANVLDMYLLSSQRDKTITKFFLI